MKIRSQQSALADARASRDNLRRARRDYHLALMIAAQRGCSADEIARELDTPARYVSNTLRNHRDGSCGCLL